MSERKVLNKYYPPDFDPAKIPRMKLPKNRQYTVRLMAPFNMRCVTCGEYIYKGKKFNARKEDVENEDYLGIRIYRFYIKCTRCLQEISFKTDPKNTDYEIEAGATRNFMALKLAEEQAKREEEEAREEEANNPMKLLENRTEQSKNEIELLESLEELKDLNRRQETIDYESMLQAYDSRISAQELEEKMQQLDEEYIKSVKFNSQKRKIVLEEEVVEELEEEPSRKAVKSNTTTETSLSSTPSGKSVPNQSASDVLTTSEMQKPLFKPTKLIDNGWNKSVGVISKKGPLKGLVKVKTVDDNKSAVGNKNEPVKSTNGLSLLGAYSDSESSNSE